MKQLVCDLGVQLRGHNLGFIQNIIRLLNERESALDDREIVFLFNTPVYGYLEIQPTHEKIHVLYITDQENEELERCTKLTDRRSAEWTMIKKYASKQSAEEVIILELDQYQLSIGASTTPFKVSGIYFRPHYRIESIGSGLLNRFKYWFWRQKKLALEYYMCRNKSLHNIFILNDSQAVYAMNQKLGDVFRYLSDPIYDYEPVPTQIRQTYQIEKDRFIFLIFGAIDERKNIEIIAEAFKTLEPKLAAKAALLIVGKVKFDYETVLNNTIKYLVDSQPSLQVINDNRFIGDGEMETLFSQCDVPLLLYRDFFVSSGLLGIAAKYNKAVMASTYGVLGELTEQYKLGLCMSPKDIYSISKCMGRLINQTESACVDGRPFYLSHSPNDFLNQLLTLNVNAA